MLLVIFLALVEPDIVCLAKLPPPDICQAGYVSTSLECQRVEQALKLSRSWPLECRYHEVVRVRAFWWMLVRTTAELQQDNTYTRHNIDYLLAYWFDNRKG